MWSYRHVGSTAGAPGFGLGVDEPSADAKVAQLDLTFSIQEDVGGLHVPVDDAMFLLQVQQRLHDLYTGNTHSQNARPHPSREERHSARVLNLPPRSSFRGSAPEWGPGFSSSASLHTFPWAPWRWTRRSEHKRLSLTSWRWKLTKISRINGPVPVTVRENWTELVWCHS